jgi:hypothetical protein
MVARLKRFAQTIEAIPQKSYAQMLVAVGLNCGTNLAQLLGTLLP